ncbi:Gfo/Idh/MocA family protein [Candidatus Pelagibacter communis]|uniref:Gfo/Idh/MocA family protein n=1 Tax=Pelagibacter ubique TaxID=198252 RepID=UPI00094D0EAC|nr:Gfo/Idh/MocA family oxidoreductase [Candidatus Pelagibacter ubique]
MNILILGLGSIGQRHLRNLKKIDKKINFYAVRKKFFTPHLDNKNKVIKGDIKKKYNIMYLKNLDQINKDQLSIDAAFVCTPSRFHIEEAIWLVKNNINIFVEKPLGDGFRNLDKLKKLLRKKSNLKHMMGYQLKFNPIILKLKDLLSKKIIGDIYYVNIHHGEHINDFHPYENYKHSYAAKKSLGGGVVLTQIHEIDYMLYLFDNYKVVNKSSISTKVSDLQIDVEDTLSAQFILRDRKRNLICQLHTNFYEKPKRRQINIIGKKGKIFCDLNKGIINVFRNGKERKILFNFDRNKIFMKQVKYFLNCIKKNKKVSSKLDVISGAKSLELALRLK